MSVIDLFKVPTVRLLAERLAAGRETRSAALDAARDRAARQRDALFKRKGSPAAGVTVR